MIFHQKLVRTFGPILLACFAFSVDANAQTYPSKPVTLIVPMAPGNAGDVNARLFAHHLSERLGQQIVVENRPGAGGVNAVKLASNATPDGHTLLYAGTFAAISQNLIKPTPYDMLREFSPIATLSGNELLILVSGDSKFKTLADLINEAKQRKDGVMCGVILLGSGQHMGAELFKQRAKVNFTIVPYRTAANINTALRSGDLDCAFEFIPGVMKHVQAGGGLRALAVASEKRTELFPDIPTAIESGVPDYVVSPWVMLVAPKGTSDSVIQRINYEVQHVLRNPDVVARLKATGTNVRAGDVAYAQNLLASEIKRWGEVIKAGNIQLK